LFKHDLQDHYRLHILHCEIIKTDSREINPSLSETRYSFQLKPDGLNAVMNYKGPLYTTEKSLQTYQNKTCSPHTDSAKIEIGKHQQHKKNFITDQQNKYRRLQITNIKNNQFCMSLIYAIMHVLTRAIIFILYCLHVNYFYACLSPGNVANNANIVQVYLICTSLL